MRKKIFGTLVIVTIFALGYSINNIAVSNTNSGYRVAIVDVQKIVSNSSEITTLKAEQEKQIQNLEKTINKAREEISKEKNPDKIAQLEEKYRNEINKQKLAIDTSYSSKLTAIDNKIKTAIVEKARSMN